MGIIGLPQEDPVVMQSLNPYPENFDQIVVVWVYYQSGGGGGGKLPIVIPPTTKTISHVKLKNEEYPNGEISKPTNYKWSILGVGVNYQLYFVHLLIETCINFWK